MDPQQSIPDDILDAQELQRVVLEKSQEIAELEKLLAQSEKEKASMTNRALKVHQENELLKAASPEVVVKRAEMELQLEMAAKFIASGAFPKGMTPEQAFTIMRAGQEMGLKEVESLQTLYIVNGAIKPYGDKMIARLTEKGYRIEYKNETKEGVDVRVWKVNPKTPEQEFDVTEHADANDQVLKNSKAMGFSAKNKLRFHGIRMIVSFHLPHLFTSVSDMFTPEFTEYEEEKKKALDVGHQDYQKERNRIVRHIEGAKTVEALNQVQELLGEYDLEDVYTTKLEELQNQQSNG